MLYIDVIFVVRERRVMSIFRKLRHDGGKFPCIDLAYSGDTSH